MSKVHLAGRVCVVLWLYCQSPQLAAGDEACESQSRELLQRLRAEVLVELDEARQQRVAEIVMEVCEQHVQDIENRWWTESADKPGNERLKRKQ